MPRLQFFLMNTLYKCSEFYEVDASFKDDTLPSDWKKSGRRKYLNYEPDNVAKNDDTDLLDACFQYLFEEYRKFHKDTFSGTYVSEEEIDEGIGNMIADMQNKKNLSVIVVVYDNMILYGDLLVNSCNYTNSVDEVTYKMEQIVDEVERVLDKENRLGEVSGMIRYLRPNMEWVLEREKWRANNAKLDASIESMMQLLEKNKV